MLSNTSMRKILYIETMETPYKIELLSMKKGMLGLDDYFFLFTL